MIVKIRNNTMMGIAELISRASCGSSPDFNLGCLTLVVLNLIQEKLDKKV